MNSNPHKNHSDPKGTHTSVNKKRPVKFTGLQKKNISQKYYKSGV